MERHTPVYIRSHSWQNLREQKSSCEVKQMVSRAPRQDCVESQIWGRVPIHNLQNWRSPRTQWPSSFLNRRSLEPPRLFLELATWPNWAIGGERPWSERWPRTWWSLWQRSRVPLWSWENLLEGQPSLQHSTNQAFMVVARQKPLLSKRHMTPAWSLTKGT